MLTHIGEFCQWDSDSPCFGKKKKGKSDMRLQLPISGGDKEEGYVLTECLFITQFGGKVYITQFGGKEDFFLLPGALLNVHSAVKMKKL